jgi:16S rRNA A1518/A1519 N6-dimethyltransferase RsmA/KsgA/DIM1 with predicted DNA glycosylase/AP lyase activity
MKLQVEAAIEMAALKPGQTLLELGCGDGKVLIAAAKRGVKVVGYEINPILALLAWVRTRRFNGQVRVIWGNFWYHTWPEADAIFVFLLDRYMSKLDKKCVQYTYKPIKLISFAFAVPNRRPIKQSKGLLVYQYK